MIKYYNNSKIDKARWDACVKHSANSILYAYSWYLDIVSPQWDALVLNDYEAVMPIPWKMKWGVKYVYQPPYCQQLGVFSPDKEYLVNPLPFIESIPGRFKSIHYNLNSSNLISIKSGNKKLTSYLKLNKDYSTLVSHYSKSHKKNIKKARVNNLKISGIKEEDFLELYLNVYKEKKLLRQFPFITTLFPKLVQEIKKHCTVEILGVFLNGNLIAACALFIVNKHIIIHTAMNGEGRKMNAMFFLIDEVIHRYSNDEYILDFAGSNIKSIQYRNMGFGAEESSYYSIQYSFKTFLSKKIFH